MAPTFVPHACLMDLKPGIMDDARFSETLVIDDELMLEGPQLQGTTAAPAVSRQPLLEIKLMEHVNLFWSRLNILTLLHACEDNLHWKETVFLHTHFAEQGINLDLAHQGINLDHKRVVQKHEQL